MKFEPVLKCVAFIYRKGSRTELEKETAILLTGRVNRDEWRVGGAEGEMASSGKA